MFPEAAAELTDSPLSFLGARPGKFGTRGRVRVGGHMFLPPGRAVRAIIWGRRPPFANTKWLGIRNREVGQRNPSGTGIARPQDRATSTAIPVPSSRTLTPVEVAFASVCAAVASALSNCIHKLHTLFRKRRGAIHSAAARAWNSIAFTVRALALPSTDDSTTTRAQSMPPNLSPVRRCCWSVTVQDEVVVLPAPGRYPSKHSVNDGGRCTTAANRSRGVALIGSDCQATT